MLRNTLAAVLLVFGSIMVSQSAHAAYEVTVNEQILPNGAAGAQACNFTYSFAVACRVHVIGYYGNGHGMEAWNNAILAPGVCEWAYVMPAYGFAFAYAEGDAFCNAAF